MTYAIQVRAPHDRNGNGRQGWIVASHGRDLEAFIRDDGNPSSCLIAGIIKLKQKTNDMGRHIFGHLDESPYTCRLPINVTVREFNRFRRMARDRNALVEV